ncbi:hypothetical protein RchiOBHm_Chr2g0147571 [Rosa chinensis]|uniref:Uncharacterized protein n=1 Tax=Rosa chinensis TaxID=74649 RepID=A0A2P6RZ54_ROSCH|nr:hypothetical protein RchiOBHm_Chr2g0147571 [Rosa chinensis]
MLGDVVNTPYCWRYVQLPILLWTPKNFILVPSLLLRLHPTAKQSTARQSPASAEETPPGASSKP